MVAVVPLAVCGQCDAQRGLAARHRHWHKHSSAWAIAQRYTHATTPLASREEAAGARKTAQHRPQTTHRLQAVANH